MAKKKISKWHPQFWLGIAVLYSLRPLAYLPYSLQMRIGKTIGWLLTKIPGKMQRVCQTNIQRCFTDLTKEQQQQLYQRNFASLGIAFIETLIAAWGTEKKFNSLLKDVQGLSAVQQTLAEKQGVILLFPHLMPMYLVGHLLLQKSQLPFSLMYHSPRNPALKYFMDSHLQKHCARVFTRHNFREMIRYLQDGNLVWYAPDLDMGRKQSIFVPFFGIDAATLITPTRLAKLANAKVFPIEFYRRDDSQGYDIIIHPALDNFPSEDKYTDMKHVNEMIEMIVRKHPEQYLWQYRRFNTRPEGEEKFY